MSLNDLQGWLVAEGLRQDLDQLTRHTVVAELDNLVPPPDGACPIRLAAASAGGKHTCAVRSEDLSRRGASYRHRGNHAVGQ